MADILGEEAPALSLIDKGKAKAAAAADSIKAAGKEGLDFVDRKSADVKDVAGRKVLEIKTAASNKIDDTLESALSWSEQKITVRVEGAVDTIGKRVDDAILTDPELPNFVATFIVSIVDGLMVDLKQVQRRARSFPGRRSFPAAAPRCFPSKLPLQLAVPSAGGGLHCTQ